LFRVIFWHIFAFTNQGSMKKFLSISTVLLFVFALSFSSCSSKKKGVKCPAYGDAQKVETSAKPA
jgi:hypothetical protein